MHNLESLEQALWFCDLEHLYAYKAGQDFSITLIIICGPESDIILSPTEVLDLSIK